MNNKNQIEVGPCRGEAEGLIDGIGVYICPELAGHITCSRHLASHFMEVVATSLCSEDLPATAEINQLLLFLRTLVCSF